MKVSLIAAMDKNRVIGSNNELPWRLPSDLRRFKSVTMGKSVVMGRKTYESIGKPLVGRHNIVVTRDREYLAKGCTVVHSIDEALLAAEGEEVMVIGGAQLYEQLLPRADRLYLTIIDAEFPGDAYFPAIDPDRWQEVRREPNTPDKKNQYAFDFVVMERRPNLVDSSRPPN